MLNEIREFPQDKLHQLLKLIRMLRNDFVDVSNANRMNHVDDNIYILDACAIIAYYKDEPGSEVVSKLQKECRNDAIDLYAHTINIYEVYYDCYRTKSKAAADELLDRIWGLPLIIENTLEHELIQEAGNFKATERLSLADSIAFGLAKVYLECSILSNDLCAHTVKRQPSLTKANTVSIKQGVVVSSDHHEFDSIEEKGFVSFYWIR